MARSFREVFPLGKESEYFELVKGLLSQENKIQQAAEKVTKATATKGYNRTDDSQMQRGRKNTMETGPPEQRVDHQLYIPLCGYVERLLHNRLRFLLIFSNFLNYEYLQIHLRVLASVRYCFYVLFPFSFLLTGRFPSWKIKY